MFDRLQRLRIPLLALADALLINLSFFIAYWMRYDLQVPRVVAPENWESYAVFQPVAWVLTLLLLVVFALGGVYQQKRGRPWLDEVYAVFSGTAIGIVILDSMAKRVKFNLVKKRIMSQRVEKGPHLLIDCLTGFLNRCLFGRRKSVEFEPVQQPLHRRTVDDDGEKYNSGGQEEDLFAKRFGNAAVLGQ